MSYSASCMVPWQKLDVARLKAGFRESLKACAKLNAGYAGARLQVGRAGPRWNPFGRVDRIEVSFPEEMVNKVGWEQRPAESEPSRAGFYDAVFELHADERGTVEIWLRSSRGANREAWISASTLLEELAERLGGQFALD